MCEHQNFHVKAEVNRLEDTKQFNMDLTVTCSDCNLPFEFLGLACGLDLQGAMVSIDGQTARLAIIPKGQKPNPLQRIAFNINKFDG